MGPLQALDLNQLGLGWSAGQSAAQTATAVPSAAATPRRADAGPRSSFQEVHQSKGNQSARAQAAVGGVVARPGTAPGRPAGPGFLGQGTSGAVGGGSGAGAGITHGGGGHFKSQVDATKRRASSASSGSPPTGGLANGIVGGMPQYLGQPAPNRGNISRGESDLRGQRRN